MESHNLQLLVIQGCGSETNLSFPPKSDDKHPAGFVTSIHENGHNPPPVANPFSFATITPPFKDRTLHTAFTKGLTTNSAAGPVLKCELP